MARVLLVALGLADFRCQGVPHLWSVGSVSYLTPFASHASAGSTSQPDVKRQDFREHLTASAAAALADQRFPAAGIPHEIAETCARGGSEGEPRLRYEDAHKAEQGTIERRLRHGCTERANYPGLSFTGCKGRGFS